MNSGSFTRSANSRQTVLWTNCEAAIEIARQMKLRNIGGVLVIDFIDMESRRDQFQLLEHFSSAIKDDSARPQIAQLTELGLVELTRKRQGQNIYELFGKKCSECNGLGHIENLPDNKNLNLDTKSSTKKSSKINNTKSPDLDSIELSEKQEKIDEREFLNSKNFNKNDESSFKKENDNEKLNTPANSKDKKVITVVLSDDEKDVYSQLGINPLVKLGKEFLTSNNLVRLKEDNNKEKDASLKNEKKLRKKISKVKPEKSTLNTVIKDVDDLNYKEINDQTKLSSIINEEKEVEVTEEIENSRRKRRRSSASIEE